MMTVGQLGEYLRGLPNQSAPVMVAVDTSDDLALDPDWSRIDLYEARNEGPFVLLWPRFIPMIGGSPPSLFDLRDAEDAIARAANQIWSCMRAFGKPTVTAAELAAREREERAAHASRIAP